MRWNENWIIMQKFRKPHLAKVNSTCLTLTLTYGDFNVLMLTYFKKKTWWEKKNSNKKLIYKKLLLLLLLLNNFKNK
jgi:hypothetical protein